MKSTRILLASMVLAAASLPVWAQDPAPPPQPEGDVANLKTGERIRGEFVGADKEKLKLKSAGLGEQEIPWDQVETLQLEGEHTVTLEDGQSWRVRARTEGAVLTLELPEGPQEFQLSELKAINPPPPPTELEKWSLKISLGLVATFGNSRQRTFSGLGELKRDHPLDPLHIGMKYLSSFGESEGEETARAHRGDLKIDYEITERAYLTPFVGNITYDKFQNIETRVRLGAGIGYYLVKAEKAKWQAEVGYSYVHTRFRRTAPGTRNTSDEHALRLASIAGWEANSWLSVSLLYENYLGLGDIQDTVHHAEGVISFKLSYFSLEIALIYDRVERPVRDASGSRPKRDDARLVVGLGVAL